MSLFRLEVKNISRGKKHSLTSQVNYITGRSLHDAYNGKSYYKSRNDVLYHGVFLPDNSPDNFLDLQSLCQHIDAAEVRYDARTGREFVCSLPNELCLDNLIDIVQEFASENFVNHNLAVIAAIHSGTNPSDPSLNNPHAHIIVSTRTVTPDGFNKHKCRDFDRKSDIVRWRYEWAKILNRAYERNGLDIKVSCESLKKQGIDREPVNRLSFADWQREKRGIQTEAGDKRRQIIEKNQERTRQTERMYEYNYDLNLPY